MMEWIDRGMPEGIEMRKHLVGVSEWANLDDKEGCYTTLVKHFSWHAPARVVVHRTEEIENEEDDHQPIDITNP